MRSDVRDDHKSAHKRLSDQHAVEWILVEQLELLSGERVRFREGKTLDSRVIPNRRRQHAGWSRSPRHLRSCPRLFHCSHARTLIVGASVSASQDFNESGDRLSQPVQQLFNAKANGLSLFSKATVDCRAIAFQQGFQKSRRADNRCVIATRRREIYIWQCGRATPVTLTSDATNVRITSLPKPPLVPVISTLRPFDKVPLPWRRPRKPHFLPLSAQKC